MEALLRVRELTVRYPGGRRPAVAEVSFEVPAGGSVALVGESGSGKSTIAVAVTRLLDAGTVVEAREISFAGEEVRTLPGQRLRALRREQLAMVFQDPTANWNPTRTIGGQLLDGLRGVERRQRRALLVETMQRVGIEDPERRLDDYPHHFSGGMLQRAMLAGGIVHRPALLVADEPTSALDTTVQAELLALMRQLQREHALSLLLISHDLGVVAQLAEATIVLYGGRVAERGPTASLLLRPQHPYTADLLAAIPRLHGPRKVPLRIGAGGQPASAGCPYASRCRFATDICRAAVPALRPIGAVEVACHHAPIAALEVT